MLDGVKKAVFIGAHADDEMICAGTLHRLVRSGVELSFLTAALPATFHDRKGNTHGDGLSDPLREYEHSLRTIGVRVGGYNLLNVLPSSDFYPHRQKICQWVYDYITHNTPGLVITLSPEDENPAHKIIGEEVERVARGRVRYLLRCQFPWNYSIGRANLFVSLNGADLEIKRAVIRAYASQHFRYRYEDMLIAQARADGLSVKVDYAERFEIVRAVLWHG